MKAPPRYEKTLPLTRFNPGDYPEGYQRYDDRVGKQLLRVNIAAETCAEAPHQSFVLRIVDTIMQYGQNFVDSED